MLFSLFEVDRENGDLLDDMASKKTHKGIIKEPMLRAAEKNTHTHTYS